MSKQIVVYSFKGILVGSEKNEILTLAIIYTHLKNIMLNEMNQTQNTTNCTIRMKFWNRRNNSDMIQIGSCLWLGV